MSCRERVGKNTSLTWSRTHQGLVITRAAPIQVIDTIRSDYTRLPSLKNPGKLVEGTKKKVTNRWGTKQ